MKDKKLRGGSVFSIRVGEGLFALGQIVRLDGYFHVCVFNKKYSLPPSLSDFDLPMEMLLLGIVSDEGFYAHRWQPLGSAPISPLVPFACYVVDGPSGTVLKTLAGKVVRLAAAEDLKFYGRKKIFSAATFEAVLKKHFEEIQEDPDYEQLSFAYVKARTCE